MSPGRPRSVTQLGTRALSHTPDTAEDSKPTAELPLLLRPVAANRQRNCRCCCARSQHSNPRISAAERSRSLYFRCKKQQKQLGAVLRNSLLQLKQYCIHHQERGQTVMPCRPQCRQLHIWAYQPAPNSSKPSCGVSSPQARQKRRNRSGRSPGNVWRRQASSDADDQSPSAASQACKRFRRIPLTGPLRCGIEGRPTRSRI